MENYKVLVAEDDPDIVEILTVYLSKNHFTVYVANNGEEAFEIMKKEKVSIVLLDIMMPKMSGYELLKRIRQKSNVPVIILSAKSKSADKIQGLNDGADAYMTKPFEPEEVMATVKSVLRRWYQYKDKIVRIGELELNENAGVLRKNGEKVNLTNTEFRILAKMMEEPGKIFTKEELYECIGEDYVEADANTMMVHIFNLRTKLNGKNSQKEYIKTIRGVGYRFEEEK